MTWQLISAILAALALIFVQWLKTRDATQKALDEKNEALEKQAAEQRKEEQAEDEKEAEEVIASGSTDRAIGFLRDSFGRAKDDKVPAPGVADGALPGTD